MPPFSCSFFNYILLVQRFFFSFPFLDVELVFHVLTGTNNCNTGMELADRAVGFLLSLTSISIFTYYTFWIIILVSSVFHSFGSAYSINLSLVFTLNLVVFQPFVDSDHFVHQYFLPQEYAILVPVFAGMVLLCFLCVFVGFVMLKSKKKKA